MKLRGDIAGILANPNHPAAVVVRDVRTGALIDVARAGARSPRVAPVDVTTPIRPLSVIKLVAAAVWLEHFGPPGKFTCHGEPEGAESIDSLIVKGCDSAGKDLAIQLRHRLGTSAVLADLRRLGFASRIKPRIAAPDDSDGVTLGAEAIPQRELHSVTTLSNVVKDSAWAAALSVGESDFATTLLDLSELLQVIGADGVNRGAQVIDSRTARLIQKAMVSCVDAGTGRAIRDVLAGTGWRIGGKTGTGPDVDRPGSGGLFASLVFDPSGHARYAIVVLTEGAGPGGGAAAQIAAAIARRLVALSDI